MLFTSNESLFVLFLIAPVIMVAAAAISASLILALRPILTRYALARPGARSSHHEPTPQGGGAAVILATLVVAIAAAVSTGLTAGVSELSWVFTSAILIATVGAADDVRAIAVGPRLFLQVIAVGMVIAVLPADFHVVPFVPSWIERLLLLIAGIWFVNVVNFMDGLDWMTVAEVMPVTSALVLLGALGALPIHGVIVALALFGAMLGFAPFNRPVARLFLGDVGSLPIGLLLAWLLMLVAGHGYFAAAILLPLYYVADATITLVRRLINGESVLQAHRGHFYQLATDRGFSVQQVVGRVFAVNLLLVALAVASVNFASWWASSTALALGVIVVSLLLASFARGCVIQAASPRKSGTASRNTR